MRWWLWIGVVTAGELLLRLALPVPRASVLVGEGLFLVGAGAALAVMLRRPPEPGLVGRRMGTIVSAAVMLAGVRSLAWGLGTPVAVANLVVLGLAMALAGWAWWRRR